MFYSCGLDDEDYMDPAENWTDEEWAEYYEENGIEPPTDKIPDSVEIFQSIAFDSML